VPDVNLLVSPFPVRPKSSRFPHATPWVTGTFVQTSNIIAVKALVSHSHPCTERADGGEATGALAEPQPVMNGNLHHCILVPQRLKLRTTPRGAADCKQEHSF
jgi:hypothetical protein